MSKHDSGGVLVGKIRCAHVLLGALGAVRSLLFENSLENEGCGNHRQVRIRTLWVIRHFTNLESM